jgi:hypothetical protein
VLDSGSGFFEAVKRGVAGEMKIWSSGERSLEI